MVKIQPALWLLGWLLGTQAFIVPSANYGRNVPALFHAPSADKFSEQDPGVKEGLESMKDQIETLQKDLDLSLSKSRLKDAELKTMRNQIRDVQTAMQNLRAQHVQEIGTLIKDLDRENSLRNKEIELHKAEIVKLKQSHTEELELVQTAATIEMETTSCNYESQITDLKRQLSNLQATLKSTHQLLEHQTLTIRKLEHEKTSLRQLARNMLTLIRTRIQRKVSRIVQRKNSSKQSSVNGSSLASMSAQHGGGSPIDMEESVFQ